MHCICTDNESDEEDFDPKWPGLNMSLIRDIFNSHKVFVFGSMNYTEYSLKDFHDDVKRAEEEIFEDAVCTPHLIEKNPDGFCDDIHFLCREAFEIGYRVESGWTKTEYGWAETPISDQLIKSNATLYPSWLISDDLFDVFSYHFAVSQWVESMEHKDIGESLNVFCCVIPEKVVSLYDHEMEYEHSVDDIGEYLAALSVDVMHHSEFKKGEYETIDILQRIQEAANSIPWRGSNVIVFLFDRRYLGMDGIATLFAFQCRSIENVVDLKMNHFIGMHFNVSIKEEDGNKSSKCWLHYGNGQRLRFWAEQLVWFIPRLFVKKKQSEYSDDLVHGFCVNLNDPIFDKYYKILTSIDPQHSIKILNPPTTPTPPPRPVICNLNWTNIVNAVKHEMNDAIVDLVHSACIDLDDLNKDSGDTLIEAIQKNAKNKLTLSEAEYLRSLIKRAMGEVTDNQTPSENS